MIKGRCHPGGLVSEHFSTRTYQREKQVELRAGKKKEVESVKALRGNLAQPTASSGSTVKSSVLTVTPPVRMPTSSTKKTWNHRRKDRSSVEASKGEAKEVKPIVSRGGGNSSSQERSGTKLPRRCSGSAKEPWTPLRQKQQINPRKGKS